MLQKQAASALFVTRFVTAILIIIKHPKNEL